MLDGEQWVVNGQKVWQTTASTPTGSSSWCAPSRTGPRAAGISILLVPIDQPGIEVRPIRTMTGEAEFSEVFFTDARTDAANIVGPRGAGPRWR